MSQPGTEQTFIQPGHEVEPTRIRRDVEPGTNRFRRTIGSSDMAMVIFLLAAGTIIFMPSVFLHVAILSGLYGWWLSRQKFGLPFRVPISWPGKDFSEPKPGRPNDYPDAAGILHVGSDVRSDEQLYLTDSDARRHMFVLGTTGSGKALPLDALVLTPSGWRRNGDLRPGDAVLKPDGRTGFVSSIHPQGKRQLYLVRFSDGRQVECDGSHLWKVCLTSGGVRPDWRGKTVRDTAERAAGRPVRIDGQEARIMETGDIGILLGMADTFSGGLEIHAPLTLPQPGVPSPFLDRANGRLAARKGISSVISGAVDLSGTVEERQSFLQGYLEEAGCAICDGWLKISCIDQGDARNLRAMIWSLGGLALAMVSAGGNEASDTHWSVCARFPSMHRLAAHVPGIDTLEEPESIRIIDIVPLARSDKCSCIKVDDEEGLFVTDSFIVTHNTEFLLGLIAQPLCWGSGFLFVDGKGTPEFSARIWSLAKRFGREGDVRVINFMGQSGDSDAPSGGIDSQSNTMNPFASGTADQLLNLLVSLMGDGEKGGGDMWKNRAIQLVSSVMRILVEMRDRGEILLDVQTIRDYLPLGKGVNRASQPRPGRGPLGRGRGRDPDEDADLSDDGLGQISEEEWEELRRRPGLIELYLRAMKGEFSEASRLALKGFFDSLPGFVASKATQGQEQDQKTLEQYGYLSMQLTKPLGQMADDFGHIFRTPLGEVDMEDVVLNRRILVVLLPALKKAPDEVKNLGKIIVAMTKIMMGTAMGDNIVGTKSQIVDSAPTKSPSPFIAVFDEAGYYMVEGFDMMAAQARSLGFCIVVAGQDIQAMKKSSAQIADSLIANTFLNVFGATMDAAETMQFIQKKVGQTTVAVSQGYASEEGIVLPRYYDRREISFQQVDRISTRELQQLRQGEFFMLLQGHLIKANNFYIGEQFTKLVSINKFLKVRGPADRAPGLDQSHEEAFRDNLLSATRTLVGMQDEEASGKPEETQQILGPIGYASLLSQRDGAREKDGLREAAALVALLSLEGVEAEIGEFEDDLAEEPQEVPIDLDIDDEDEIHVGGLSTSLKMRGGQPGKDIRFDPENDDDEDFPSPFPAMGPMHEKDPARISDKAVAMLADAEAKPADRRKAEDHILQKTEDEMFPAPPTPEEQARMLAAQRQRRKKQEREKTLLERTGFLATEQIERIDRTAGANEKEIAEVRKKIASGGQIDLLNGYRFPKARASDVTNWIDKATAIAAVGIRDGDPADSGTREMEKAGS